MGFNLGMKRLKVTQFFEKLIETQLQAREPQTLQKRPKT